MVAEQHKRIAELDGLRAFAVLAVVVFHMAMFGGSLPSRPGWIANTLGSLGEKGVAVFFVISGFIITSLLIREEKKFGRISLKAFYVRRFFRIVPPFAAYLLTIALLRHFGFIELELRRLFFSALFLGDTTLVGNQAWFVAHTWSLSVEEQYYLFFPAFLALAVRHRRGVLTTIGVLYCLCLVSLKAGHDLSLHSPGLVNVSLLYHFRYILAGVALALFRDKGVRFPFPKFYGLVPIALGLFIVFSWSIYLPTAAGKLIVPALEPIACALFVIWFVDNPQSSGLLRNPVVQWLGACSYSIYLWQQLFTGPSAYYFKWNLSRSAWSAVAIFACAAISYYAVELPSIYWGRRFSKHIFAERQESPAK